MVSLKITINRCYLWNVSYGPGITQRTCYKWSSFPTKCKISIIIPILKKRKHAPGLTWTPLDLTQPRHCVWRPLVRVSFLVWHPLLSPYNYISLTHGENGVNKYLLYLKDSVTFEPIFPEDNFIYTHTYICEFMYNLKIIKPIKVSHSCTKYPFP